MSALGESIYYADKAMKLSEQARAMEAGPERDALRKEVKKLEQKARWAHDDAAREAREDHDADMKEMFGRKRYGR